MRLTLDLPHLKPATATANAKYRRRVPDEFRSVFGKSAVEWSLGTKDPLEIFKAWELAHARFEAVIERGSNVSANQLQWEMVLKAAIEHGLATPRDTKIGPVDFEAENGRYMAFAQAAIAEGAKLSPQQMNAKFANKPARTASDLLLEAQVKGIERPPVTLGDAVDNYLKDRESRSTYADITKQVNLVRKGIVEVVGEENPSLESITFEHAYAYRDKLKEKESPQAAAIAKMLWLEVDWSSSAGTFPFAWPSLGEHTDKTTTYFKMVLDAYGGQKPS